MFDCFTINDEVDLIDLRLNMLAPFVEKFVIVESDRTHSGKPKELTFPKMLTKYGDKIIYLVYPGHEVSNGHMAWGNEGSQRNMILQALNKAWPRDGFLFISDVDEIPRPESLIEARCLACRHDTFVAFSLHYCLYYMNFATDIPIRGSYLYNPGRAQEIHERYGQTDFTPTHIRWHAGAIGYEKDFPTVHDAGWHFSSLGGVDAVRRKLSSYAHLEFNNPEILAEEYLKKCMDEGILYHEKMWKCDDKVRKFKKMDDDFLPEYVQYHMDKYRKYMKG